MSQIVEVLPLGVNGFYPSYGRQTMSFLLFASDGSALLLDAGTGFGRLAEPGVAARLADQERLDVVLSHYHLDHTIGLTYASGAWGRPLRIFCPAPPLVDAEPEDAFGRLIAPPLFPLRYDAFPVPIEIESYRGDFAIAGIDIRTRRQTHPGGSTGLRFGDSVAYLTDTVGDQASIAFSTGVDLLMHEIWASDEEASEHPFLVKGHTAIGPALEIADQAGARSLMPVHYHPKRNHQQLEGILAEISERSSVPMLRAVEGQSCRWSVGR